MSATAAAAAPEYHWFKFEIAWVDHACWRRIAERLDTLPAIVQAIFIGCLAEINRSDERDPETVLAELAQDHRISLVITRRIVEELTRVAGDIGRAIGGWLEGWRKRIAHRLAQARQRSKHRRDPRQIEMLLPITPDHARSRGDHRPITRPAKPPDSAVSSGSSAITLDPSRSRTITRWITRDHHPV